MLQKTRKGATSMIVIIFFTLLAGILVLSFVGVMLSNITQSTNYDLSQSAYDAALAGIEDAKVMLLEYNNCMARGDLTSPICSKVITSVNAKDSEKNCDLVRDSLGRPGEDSNETLVRSDSSSVKGSAAENLDMAYTCVLVSTDVADYLGTIQNDSDMKVIPLRTSAESSQTSKANTVKVQWYSSRDFEKDNDTYDRDPFGSNGGFTKLSTTRMFSSSKTAVSNQDYNKFGSKATLPPVLNVGLIQTANTFNLYQFYENVGLTTNRGRITLRPINKSGNTAIANSNTSGFAVSATAGYQLTKEQYSAANYDVINSSFSTSLDQNSPYDVNCLQGDSIKDGSYACTVYIQLPEAVGGSTNDFTRFLTLSTPYSSPEISFSVAMLECDVNAWAPPVGCKTVNFVGVQSSVDSTGRANDVFRRVDARVELVDTGYPFPKYAVGLHGGEDTTLSKSYEATYNCWKINQGSNISCKDFEAVTPSWTE